jgi:puromycin-sensitive aminopeptidase
MMYNFIGDACFRKGMNAYLEKFKYANAETQDLWDALEAASDKPVGKFMNTFTKQMGFPIITVIDVTVQEAGKCFTLKQEKFWADPKLNSPENAESNANYKWIIPITFCKASNPLESCASELFDGLKSDITKIFVPKVSPDEWVKVS